jgi:hypothetical protein
MFVPYVSNIRPVAVFSEQNAVLLMNSVGVMPPAFYSFTGKIPSSPMTDIRGLNFITVQNRLRKSSLNLILHHFEADSHISVELSIKYLLIQENGRF